MTAHLEEYSHDQSSMAAEVEVYTACMNSTLSIMRKKKSKINKRRFSDEQIKSLESIFETESRLEPRKKLLLARELGLQPRQVAIWFQNKRARWKSKQIEKEYSILRANFNSLAARYESVKKEKQSLVTQLQLLNEQIGKPQEDHSQACAHSKAENSMDSAQSYNGDTVTCEAEVKAVLSEERPGHGGSGVLSDSHDSEIKAEYFSLEEGSELMNLMEPAGEDSMTSTEDWGKFDSDGLLDQSTSGSPWWDFWS